VGQFPWQMQFLRAQKSGHPTNKQEHHQCFHGVLI
jgi:hypothetical protein